MLNVVSGQNGVAGGPGSRGQTGEIQLLSVLLPVYNEERTLAKIVDRVLRSPVPLEMEIIAVDDGSSDGSWALIEQLAAAEPRVKPIKHARNRGKGAAIRTAIAAMTGQVAVVQDADLEYDPVEYPRLLAPILRGEADAVYGSRYAGRTRSVHPFWHTLVNQTLTLAANMADDLTLSDMETCYKMVRADVLKRLRLSSDTFTIEPEITCRLAQWGARIHEVPISYRRRSYEQGKKIRPMDGLRALWQIFYSRFVDRRFALDENEYRRIVGACRAEMPAARRAA